MDTAETAKSLQHNGQRILDTEDALFSRASLLLAGGALASSLPPPWSAWDALLARRRTPAGPRRHLSWQRLGPSSRAIAGLWHWTNGALARCPAHHRQTTRTLPTDRRSCSSRPARRGTASLWWASAMLNLTSKHHKDVWLRGGRCGARVRNPRQKVQAGVLLFTKGCGGHPAASSWRIGPRSSLPYQLLLVAAPRARFIMTSP